MDEPPRKRNLCANIQVLQDEDFEGEIKGYPRWTKKNGGVGTTLNAE